MPRIAATGWGWRHAGRHAWAVRGLDLVIEPGERVLLLGASGAGKSTVLAGIAGLLDGSVDGTGESEGTLLVDGVPARQARAGAAGGGQGRVNTGLLLQDPEAQTVLARIGDDVAFGLENHAVARQQIWPRVRQALADVDLGHDLGHSTSRLSGGQRQRLALAGVLALRPGLLLLDEPTSMLDPAATAALRAVVGRVLTESGGGALVVEHRVAEWLPVVDRVVVLAAGGGVMADGPPHQVFADHGQTLAAAGVWVPGRATPSPPPGAGASGEMLLAARDLGVSRAGRPAPVLSGVEAEVHAGRAVALQGHNGSGKSTLALALGGLARPSAGSVVAGAGLRDGTGPTPTRWSPRELVARIGSVFQDPRHQFVARTVADELAVGPRRVGRSTADIERTVTELLQRLRLDHLARANPFTLSGGEQRRLSVATALATAPRVLVLDEPTFGQDARTWAELIGLLREALQQGTAVVTATHDPDVAPALAADTWQVANGGVHVVEATVPR